MRRIQLKIYCGRECELLIEHDIGEYISRQEVAIIAHVTDSKLRRMIKAGVFPAPVEMFDGSHGFPIEDVLSWFNTAEKRC